MTEQQFFRSLDAVLDAGHLLKHPFYQAWSAGSLSQETLREYAGEYYRLVRAFPTFVSATHAACDDIDVRRMLLENLMEEEGGEPHHPELWLRFAEALGAGREATLQRKCLPQTEAAVRRLRELSRSEDPVRGLAALYAYEAQAPAVATTKIEGLEQFYGIGSDDGLAFFRVHQQADQVHSAVTRAALGRLCATEEQRQQALEAAGEAAAALNLLLDGVHETWCATAASC